MIRTNKNNVVKQSLQGKIHHPLGGGYRVAYDGKPRILPATGGISYNVKLGDSVYGWAGDHVEPGVSIRNESEPEKAALATLSCIGNEAKVITGDAKGAKGYVTGAHGGIDHVLVYFEQDDLEKMAIDDKILIKGYGQGLELLDYPDIKMMSIDPDLLLNMNIREENGKLIVPVVAKVPPYLMGSGIGSPSPYIGDYDIMTADRETIKELGLDKLKFGDVVLLEDCDNSFGRGYQKGAVTIGIIIHSDCILMGHGPGVTTIMSSKDSSVIKCEIDENANIGKYLEMY